MTDDTYKTPCEYLGGVRQEIPCGSCGKDHSELWDKEDDATDAFWADVDSTLGDN